MHTYSKAFGELVQTACGTPHVSARELVRMLETPRPPVVIDCRPRNEYRHGSLSASVNLPGIELPYRLRSLVPDTSTPIVVHCAGRTRSIIGAQTLIEAGAPNPVSALENGTMGWLPAGLPIVTRERLESGPSAGAPPAPELAVRCRMLAAAFGVKEIGRTDVDVLLRSDEAVTLGIDVRAAEEFAFGHHPAAVHAPGGQRLQATDRFAVVRGATLVLADDDGLRATLTAAWLRRMGWSRVLVMPMRSARGPIAAGPAPRQYFRSGTRSVGVVDADTLHGMIETGRARVNDLDASIRYIRGHVPTARFIKRSSLCAVLKHPLEEQVAVLCCADGTLSCVVAEALPARHAVSVLKDGKRGWVAAGHRLEPGSGTSIDAHDDVWRSPWDAPGDVEPSMRQYLEWEVGLLEQMRTDPTVAFTLFASSVNGRE